MRTLLLVASLLVLAACGGCSAARSYPLEERWRPLERIDQRDLPGVSDTAITTMGNVAYTADLEAWLARHDPDELEAVLLHEQEHARRQIATGTAAWCKRYLDDPAFAWAEEQIGWTLELQHLRSRGRQIDVDKVAQILDGYSVPGGDLVTRDAARAWVVQVLGR